MDVSFQELVARIDQSTESPLERLNRAIALGDELAADADRVQSTFTRRLRPRLRACLDQAQREAQADGSTEVGTHHLLAGLLAEGVAAAILEKLGVTADVIRDSGHRLFGPPLQATDLVPP